MKIFITKFFIFLSFTIPNILSSQSIVMQDFSYPICANGNGESMLNFYDSYNGAVNNCEYKVVLATLFTSW